MFQFFDAIANIFSTVVNFVINFVNNVIMILSMIFKAVYVVFVLIGYMPVVIQVVLIAMISYIVIINVLKKGG